jgi:hypothetical protein
LGGSEANAKCFLSSGALTGWYCLIIGLLAVILDLGGVGSRCDDGLRVPTGLADRLTTAYSYRTTAVIRLHTECKLATHGLMLAMAVFS